MSELFDQRDRYLLENWPSVQRLQQGVEALQGKYYDRALTRVVDAVQEAHQELDHAMVRRWGGIVVAKTAWLVDGNGSTPGFWLEGIGLDNLGSEDGETPHASVWLKPPKGMTKEHLAGELHKAARQVLKASEFKRVKSESERAFASVWYYLPEARGDLFQMLVSGKASQLIDCLVSHFETLARFTAAVDEIYRRRLA